MKVGTSTTYYLQGIGQSESTDKVLGTLLTNLISENRIDWDEHLSIVLFSYRIAYKITRYIISINAWITSSSAHRIHHSLQQQGAILRSKYHRKQQRKMFSKSRCCEP
jgi:hypothetical protein